jgi:hypothetical protein
MAPRMWGWRAEQLRFRTEGYTWDGKQNKGLGCQRLMLRLLRDFDAGGVIKEKTTFEKYRFGAVRYDILPISCHKTVPNCRPATRPSEAPPATLTHMPT